MCGGAPLEGSSRLLWGRQYKKLPSKIVALAARQLCVRGGGRDTLSLKNKPCMRSALELARSRAGARAE